MDYMALIKDFGLPVALVIFFVVQGTKREAATNKRMDDMSEFQRATLLNIIAEQNLRETEHVERAKEHNRIMTTFGEVLKGVLEVLKK